MGAGGGGMLGVEGDGRGWGNGRGLRGDGGGWRGNGSWRRGIMGVEG